MGIKEYIKIISSGAFFRVASNVYYGRDCFVDIDSVLDNDFGESFTVYTIQDSKPLISDVSRIIDCIDCTHQRDFYGNDIGFNFREDIVNHIIITDIDGNVLFGSERR